MKKKVKKKLKNCTCNIPNSDDVPKRTKGRKERSASRAKENATPEPKDNDLSTSRPVHILHIYSERFE